MATITELLFSHNEKVAAHRRVKKTNQNGDDMNRKNQDLQKILLRKPG
ncbi:MAG: hypothetical protein GX147_09055 [Deltaproteobacteria bacterium]|nr:hypothetical protein [Deltaproteobacteria bacterium]